MHRGKKYGLFLLFVLMGLLITPTFSSAKDKIYTAPWARAAVMGYDVTSYFSQDAVPIKGDKMLKTVYKDVDWHFEKPENMAKFKAAPDKYMPQYGGYCAYAASEKKLYSTKPTVFAVFEGKLYFFYNEATRDAWLQNPPYFITNANTNWPELNSRYQN